MSEVDWMGILLYWNCSWSQEYSISNSIQLLLDNNMHLVLHFQLQYNKGILQHNNAFFFKIPR